MNFETLAVCAVWFFCSQTVYGSPGDTSNVYQHYLKSCTSKCSDGEFDSKQSLYMKLLYWDCKEECKYSSMWPTVKLFEKNNLRLPQFYGKWPFLRILGVQEPASVLFSMLNGLTTLIGFQYYKSKVPCHAPLYNLYYGQAIIGVNAWIWSSVFHARDFPVTEKLDYFCATSLVVYAFYLALHRLSYEVNKNYQKLMQWTSANILAAFYLGHVCYLSFDTFDYAYNMKANMAVASLNSITWYALFFKLRHKKTHMWKIALGVFLLNIFLTLEVLDFPPYLWTFDAHSLWHLATVPIPLLMFSFYADDSLELMRDKQIEKKNP